MPRPRGLHHWKGSVTSSLFQVRGRFSRSERGTYQELSGEADEQDEGEREGRGPEGDAESGCPAGKQRRTGQ